MKRYDKKNCVDIHILLLFKVFNNGLKENHEIIYITANELLADNMYKQII